MANIIKQLKTPDNVNNIFPRTVSSAVFMEDGENLNNALDSLKNAAEDIGEAASQTAIAQILKTLGVDYIVAQGTSGIWTYRKWNSGIAECWGVRTVSVSPNSTWGSTKYTNISPETYPTSLFIDKPFVTATVNKQTGSGMPIISLNSCTATTLNAYIDELSGGTYTYTIDIYFNVKGRWK